RGPPPGGPRRASRGGVRPVGGGRRPGVNVRVVERGGEKPGAGAGSPASGISGSRGPVSIDRGGGPGRPISNSPRSWDGSSGGASSRGTEAEAAAGASGSAKGSPNSLAGAGAAGPPSAGANGASHSSAAASWDPGAGGGGAGVSG